MLTNHELMSFRLGLISQGRWRQCCFYVRLWCGSGTDQAPPVQLIQYFIPESVLVLKERMLEAEVLEAITRTDACTHTGCITILVRTLH